jgi:hypothetical protein
MPHPLGNIEVNYDVEEDNIEAIIRLPEKLKGTFVWDGKAYELESGQQRFSIN